jgi:hypothetical protein
MTVTDDPIGATTAEISDELIFLIASASTADQRKYATELFRHFARQVALESYRLGQRSMAVPRLPAPVLDNADITASLPRQQGDATSLQPSQSPPDDPSVGLIPPISWQD